MSPPRSFTCGTRLRDALRYLGSTLGTLPVRDLAGAVLTSSNGARSWRAGCTARLQAGAQHIHQINDIAALAGRGGLIGQRDLLAFHLLLNGRFHATLELIHVGCGIKRL